MVPSRTEPFTRLFYLQDCDFRLTFAASIIDTTSRLMLQKLSGGILNCSIMQNTALQTIVGKNLPALSGESITYNAAKNVFLTQGYTSAAGNMYYRAIRISDRLAIYYDLGQGYKYTFLNGIKLFCWDGQQARVVAQKYWGSCDWRVFNEQFAKEQSILMLKDYLAGQLKIQGAHVSDQDVLAFSRNMIEETMRKQIA